MSEENIWPGMAFYKLSEHPITQPTMSALKETFHNVVQKQVARQIGKFLFCCILCICLPEIAKIDSGWTRVWWKWKIN